MDKATKKYLLSLILFGSNGIVASLIDLPSVFIVLARVSLGAAALAAAVLLSRPARKNLQSPKHPRQAACLYISGAALGAEFTFYTYGIQFVVSLLAFALTQAFGKNDKTRENEKQPVILFRTKAIGCGAAFGAINGTAFLLSSVAAEHVAAVAQYPLITGATILFSSLLAFLFYREKPTALQLIQIAISFAATVLFMF